MGGGGGGARRKWASTWEGVKASHPGRKVGSLDFNLGGRYGRRVRCLNLGNDGVDLYSKS